MVFGRKNLASPEGEDRVDDHTTSLLFADFSVFFRGFGKMEHQRCCQADDGSEDLRQSGVEGGGRTFDSSI